MNLWNSILEDVRASDAFKRELDCLMDDIYPLQLVIMGYKL